jgi:hypothetical protein
MLLTAEAVQSSEDAARILRWYAYRWRVEEYHKFLKSGTQVECYRLVAEGMESLLGFLSVIAIAVLKARSQKPPQRLTVNWGVEAIARLGGYLEHRRKSPIGIQVLWRGWSKLQDLCEGWHLATQT